MRIQLKFLGSLQYDLSKQTQDFFITKKDPILKDLLLELLSRNEFNLLSQFLSESLELKRSLLIFINEQEISVLQGINTELEQNDLVSFIPVIHGGYQSFLELFGN